MNKKRKLYIKVKETLKTERKTIIILLVTSIIALIISILLEYFGKSMICYKVKKLIHIDYLINVMLGLAASSFISFASLVFQYLYRKNERVSEIKSRLKKIYYHYMDINNSIKTNQVSESYVFEQLLKNNVDRLLKEIDDEIKAYEKSEFNISVIDQINEVLSNDIRKNLSAISIFIINFFSFNNKDDNVKDAIIKRSEVEFYQFLFKTINNNYSSKELKKQYSQLLTPEELLNGPFFILEEELDDYNKQHNDLELNLIICNGLYDIYKKHSNALLKEKKECYERINNLPINMVNREKIDEISAAIRIGEIEKAKQLIDQLEKEVENFEANNSEN